MEIEIVKTKEMPMLSRKRLTCTVTFDKETPTRIQINNKLGAQISVNPELIITKHIYTKFGERTAKVLSHVYSSIDELNRNEEEKIISKNRMEKKERKSNAPGKKK